MLCTLSCGTVSSLSIRTRGPRSKGWSCQRGSYLSIPICLLPSGSPPLSIFPSLHSHSCRVRWFEWECHPWSHTFEHSAPSWWHGLGRFRKSHLVRSVTGGGLGELKVSPYCQLALSASSLLLKMGLLLSCSWLHVSHHHDGGRLPSFCQLPWSWCVTIVTEK